MPRRLGKTPELYTIPSRLSFVDALARGIMERYGQDPLALSDVLVLLPNRRAARALGEAFLRLGAGRSLLLPRLQPIGDVDEDELLLGGGDLPQGADNLELAPGISPYQRQMLLMDIIVRWYRGRGERPPEVAQAAILAEALGRFLDQVQTERLSFGDLTHLVPEDYAVHWQETLDFLRILTLNWPAVLRATGHMDAAARRNALLEGLRDRWLQTPPAHPVIAAGSTGSIPATADLLELITRLPQGMVILPGVDVDMDEESWQALGPAHPQYTMKHLLQRIGADRIEVGAWLAEDSGIAQSSRARERLFTEIMRPAATTDRWRDMDLDLEAATAGLVRLDLPGAREEAGAIALMLRDVLETEGRTAALVTPDRHLARRVAGEMRRWGVIIDDSAGTPLFNTPPGLYLRLTAHMAGEGFTPVPLLSALKHPLMSGGEDLGAFRKKVRQLEKYLLRGPRPGAGLKGIAAALDAALEDKMSNSRPLRDLKNWWGGLMARLKPLEDLLGRPEASLQDLLTAHLQLAEALAATDGETGAARLWKGEAGEAAARLMEDLQLAAHSLRALPPRQYPALLEVFMGGVTVRPRYGQHPRLHIWGPLEARLQQADLVILAGLNEASWPPEAAVDPWMSRPMRDKFGLPPLEQKIGLSAHDFIQAASAPAVVLTRAEKQDGTPTVKSRWLARMEAIVPPHHLAAKKTGGAPTPWAAWHRLLDQPAETLEIAPPCPAPPVKFRPRQLSVTAIQTWMRDPYSLYARYILGLKPLDPLDADPGAADKGIIIHAALDRFMTAYPDRLPPDALDRLIAMGREEFGHVLDRPTVGAFWWPRFQQVAEWFVAEERRRRNEGYATAATEIAGALDLPAPGGTFRLTAKADRIDRRPDGDFSIIDYKTGQSATARQLHAGYAPQLPLEGLMLRGGAFAGVAGEVGDLSYWRLKGGAMPAEITCFEAGGGRAAKMDVGEVIDKARDGLMRLITRFDLPDTPYLSTPRPEVLGYGEYDHLARTKEWQGRLRDGDEGDAS